MFSRSSRAAFLALPLSSRLAAVVLIVGALTTIFGGMSATFAWVGYSTIAALTPQPRTVPSLAADPPRPTFALSSVEATPDDTAQIRIQGVEWTMWTAREGEGVVFLSSEPPPPQTATLLVDQDTETLIPPCDFRQRHMKAGTPIFRVGDPRPQAAADATLAGWTAAFGWPAGLLMTGLGIVWLRRRRSR